MDLSDRKKLLLQAIIQDFIEYAEPVGSRTISKRYMSDLSSATIRNEMADLEDLGFLEQPHTSAGRIPTDLGYRVFVDSLMQDYALELRDMLSLKDALHKSMQELDRLIAQASSMLSNITNYASLAIVPEVSSGKIESLHTIYVDAHKIVMVLVTEEGMVKSRLASLSVPITAEGCAIVSGLIGSSISGKSFDQINHNTTHAIRIHLAQNAEILDRVLDFIDEVNQEILGRKIVVDGSTRLLGFPEYSDVGKARRMLELMQNTDSVQALIAAPMGEARIKVIIGSENDAEEFKNCSVVLSDYHAGNLRGKIGVIGPTRMNYPKVISALSYLTGQINKIFDTNEKEDDPHGQT